MAEEEMVVNIKRLSMETTQAMAMAAIVPHIPGAFFMLLSLSIVVSNVMTMPPACV